MEKNLLYYGDNLDVLKRHIKDASVDLVYLDPPFNSNATYNVLFAEQNGTQAAAQIKAFEDTWRWDQEAAREYEETVETGGEVSKALMAFRTLLGESNMMAYLAMMAPRLVELRRVLKPTGSIYLHCDPTASHYLKLLMDAVFGPMYFRSDITWQRTNTHSDAKRWSPIADTLLYYGKTDAVTWHPTHSPHSEGYLQSKYRHQDPDGRRYQLDNMTSPHARPNMMYEWMGYQFPAMGWRYSRETMAKLDAEGRIWYPDSLSKRPRLKRYLDEMSGVLLGNIWTDIAPINSQAQERLGYPTQKPLALLERILKASSSPRC
jgi:site-specific DNA-methyltransferase (adenine-specific)